MDVTMIGRIIWALLIYSRNRVHTQKEHTDFYASNIFHVFYDTENVADPTVKKVGEEATMDYQDQTAEQTLLRGTG